MNLEREDIQAPEALSDQLDLSDQVAEILASGRRTATVDLYRLLNSDAVRNAPSVTITLDYTTLDHAKWLKAFLEKTPPGKNWQAAIRATEAQMKEAANIFASGVKWILKEEHE